MSAKATSNTRLYDSNPEIRKSTVRYEAGEVPCFKRTTIIQPENIHTIPHRALDHRSVIGTMPKGFHERLLAAIKQSTLVNARWRVILLGRLEA